MVLKHQNFLFIIPVFNRVDMRPGRASLSDWESNPESPSSSSSISSSSSSFARMSCLTSTLPSSSTTLIKPLSSQSTVASVASGHHPKFSRQNHGDILSLNYLSLIPCINSMTNMNGLERFYGIPFHPYSSPPLNFRLPPPPPLLPYQPLLNSLQENQQHYDMKYNETLQTIKQQETEGEVRGQKSKEHDISINTNSRRESVDSFVASTEVGITGESSDRRRSKGPSGKKREVLY